MFNGLHRLILRTAFFGWRMKSRLLGGTLRGAVAVLWIDDQVLLVHQSYRKIPMLPGGVIDSGESPDEAVLREIREELGLNMISGNLALALQGTWEFEKRREEVWLYEGTIPSDQTIQVDGKEILSVSYALPSEILHSRAGPPYLLDYLEQFRAT